MVSENDPVLTNTPETTTRTYANFARRTTETVTELNEQRTSAKATTQLPYKDFTDSTVLPEQQTEQPEFITVTADIDYTVDNNQNEVTTRTNDLDTYSPTLINNSPNTPTNRPTSSVESNDKTDQNKKVTTNTITTVGSFTKETQESIDSQTITPDFHGIVSSPRPFEFSKRTRRPAVRFTSSTVPTTTASSIPESPVSPSVSNNKVSSFAYVASNPRRTIANLLLQRRENDDVKVDVEDQVSDGFTTVDDTNDSQELNVDTTRYIDSSTSSTSASSNISPSSTTTKYDVDSHETFDNSFNRPNRFRTKSSGRDETRQVTSRRQFASTEPSNVDEVTQSRRVIPRRKLRPVEDDTEYEGPKQTTKTIVRPLRPTIESDLSSLTAADFSKYSFVPKNTVRRIWPTRTTTTSTTVDYSNLDANAYDNDGNAIRASVRRRPTRPSTAANRIAENDASKIVRVSLQRPLGRRKSLNVADESNLDSSAQTAQTDDYTDSDSASNSQHFTISQDDFTNENVVTTDAPLKLTLERKLSFGAADNRFDAQTNHRVNVNRYVSDSPIIYLNSRSTARPPLKLSHTEDTEQVSLRTDSSTLLNPLIYSLVIDNTNSDDISTTSIDSVPTTTVRSNIRRPSYRSRTSDSNETKPQSGRKTNFRTISKSSYSEFDEITEVSSVDSSILSRQEGEFEVLPQDETTTIIPKVLNEDLSDDLIKEIDNNQIYQNTPVSLLNPLLALNLIDTTLSPDSTQPDSTDANFDSTEGTDFYRTDSPDVDDGTTEPSTESAKSSERTPYRGRIKAEIDEDARTNRRPTYRGRASTTTESNTEIDENDGDVTESERRPTPRRNNRRPYQNRNDVNSEQQEVNSRRTNRRPLHRSRTTTEATDGNSDDVQSNRQVVRRPSGRINSDEEDSTGGNRVQIRRRRPTKGNEDETSTPLLRNRVRRPNYRPIDGFEDDEERQTNSRGRVRRPIARPSFSDSDGSDESTGIESSFNDSPRTDSESISLIRSSGRKAIAQIFDEIAATDENVDTATDTPDDGSVPNRVPSNTEIEDKIRSQSEETSNGVVNRRRKIIRRLRPFSTTEQTAGDGISNESSSVPPRRKVVRKLIRRPSSTARTPYHDANGNIELLPVRGTFGPHDAEKLNSSEEERDAVLNRRGKAKLFPDAGDDVENYYDNDVFSNDDKNNDTDDDEYEVNDEDYENQTNNKLHGSTTTQKTVLNSRLYASRPPFNRPTRPSADHVASTVESVTSPKSYVRKYSSKFVSPNQPLAEDNSEEGGLIGTVKPFVVHENLHRYRGYKKDNDEVHASDDDDDELNDDDDVPKQNVKLNYGVRRPSNRPFSNQGIREDYEEDDQEKPIRKQNRPFGQSDAESVDEKPLVRPSPFNRPKYFIPSKKDETDDVEIETDDKSNSPYKPKPPRVRTSLPTGTTTKSSRKQNNPYTNKKFTSPSGETSSSNPLLDDLDRNALNSRNKKIFEKSSKKHLILNPTSTQHQHESIDQTNTSNTSSPSNSEYSEYNTEDYTHTMSTNDGGEYSTLADIQFDDTTQDNLLNTINFNELQEATTEDQSVVFKIGRPTTTPKPTTLHHVFAIDYDEKTEMIQLPMEVAPEEKTSELITQKVEKIAEVSRVVEIYSQQETHNGDNKSTQSNLVIEKLPTVNKLGEISRITLIKLVEQNKENNSLNEITKPTTLSHSDESKRHAKSIQKLISPETIFSVETSTIPLEALFQNERTSKVLSASEQKAESAIGNEIATIETDKNRTKEIFTTDISPTKHVIQIEPEARPLVISLANLDKVVLSKLTNKSASAGNDSATGHATGQVSTKNVDDAPQVVLVASNDTSKTDSTLVDSIDPIVNTQTSYSSESSRVVKKSPKVTEHHLAEQPARDGLEQTDAQPSKKVSGL